MKRKGKKERKRDEMKTFEAENEKQNRKWESKQLSGRNAQLMKRNAKKFKREGKTKTMTV